MRLIQILLVAFSSLLLGCSSVLDYEIQYEQIAAESYPVITSVGYAPISTQRGMSDTERMLNAMKASKLEAYRELAERIYGQHIKARSGVEDMHINMDNIEVQVDAVVRGARVVKSYPTGDLYATELRLDTRQLYEVINAMQTKKKISDINYFWR